MNWQETANLDKKNRLINEMPASKVLQPIDSSGVFLIGYFVEDPNEQQCEMIRSFITLQLEAVCQSNLSINKWLRN